MSDSPCRAIWICNIACLSEVDEIGFDIWVYLFANAEINTASERAVHNLLQKMSYF